MKSHISFCILSIFQSCIHVRVATAIQEDGVFLVEELLVMKLSVNPSYCTIYITVML